MELKEEKKREVEEPKGGRERGRREEYEVGERDLVKNGYPAREDSLGLRRTMRPCSGRDSFLVLVESERARMWIRPIDV